MRQVVELLSPCLALDGSKFLFILLMFLAREYISVDLAL